MGRHAAIIRITTGAVLGAASLACAGPPFITDDPEPVEYQHWEFYAAFQYRHESGGNSFGAPALELNYGAIPDVQLHIATPFVADDPGDGSFHYGYGDTELGVKYRFIHETDSIPQVAIFPAIEVPTGNEHEGLGSGHVQLFIPVWLQKSWDNDQWTTFGGGGWQLNPGDGNRDFWRFGWALQRKLSEHLSLGGELYYISRQTTDGESSTGFNLGTIIDITEHHHILFSAGRDFSGPNHFSCYLAYQLTF